MFELFSSTAMAAAAVVLAAATAINKKKDLFYSLAGGDEDMKIADGSFRDRNSNTDSAEAAAEDFLRQRNLGNIEVARELGKGLAKELWIEAQELIMNDEDEYSSQQVHQRILLYTYAVNNFIGDFSPNSILAETALSVFYSHLEELSSVLSQHVSDTAGFSLYILNQRSRQGTDQVGEIYARLSGEENSKEIIAEGNRKYNEFYTRCEKKAKEEISFHN